MLIKNIEYDKWRSEQLKYFKKHLRYLEKGSLAYNIILKGINDFKAG
jgi:hypothetical protein